MKTPIRGHMKTVQGPNGCDDALGSMVANGAFPKSPRLAVVPTRRLADSSFCAVAISGTRRCLVSLSDSNMRRSWPRYVFVTPRGTGLIFLCLALLPSRVFGSKLVQEYSAG